MTRTLKFFSIFLGIPLVLLIIGFLLSSVQFYRQNISFLSLTKAHSIHELTTYKSGNLLASDKFAGEFVAMDDFLGIVGVRFNTFWQINDDWLIFRIKEKGSPNWYYENRYKVDQFQNNEIFPFGFPVIQNSKGKVYDFEVESTAGTVDDSVALDLTEPVFISIYKYPKELILSGLGPLDKFLPEKFASLKHENIGGAIQTQYFVNQSQSFVNQSQYVNKTVYFIYEKIASLIFNVQFPALSIFNFLPLFIYLYWLFVYRHFKHKKYFILVCPLILIFIESLLLPESIDFIVLEILFMWIWVLRYYRLDYMTNFQLAFMFLLLAPVFLWLNLPVISEKFGSWSFLFITVGIFHIVLDQRFDLHYKHRYLALLKKIPLDFRET